jgi:2-isopropylmalate synthase
MRYEELIHDWNHADGFDLPPGRKYMLDDETLRDGLQSPSVRDPDIDTKIRLVHLMDRLGVQTVDLGLPGAGPRAVADVERLAREIVNARLKIRPNCAARTVEADIRPIAEISQRAGIAIEAATFLGSSPIRRYAEDWTVDFLLRTTEHAVTYARQLGLPVMYVTEDTTRCDPDTIKKLYTTAIRYGAEAAVVCDTVGHVTPRGVKALLRFMKEEVIKPTGATVRIDWHGHRDRGLAVANSLAAFEAGADQVHGCALGIGERVGNTPIDLVLVNLKLAGPSTATSRAWASIAKRFPAPPASPSRPIIRSWAAMPSAPPPACMRLRSSRPTARTTFNSPTVSIPACPRICLAASK